MGGNPWEAVGRRLGAVSALIVVVLLWEAAVRIFAPAAFLLPSPLQVFATLYENLPFLARHAGITLYEMLAGLGIGGIAGVSTAIILAQSRIAKNLLLPAIVTTQTLPVFAIAPLLVVWFGFGAGSKIAMAALIIFFPIASAFHDGLTAVDRHWLDLARSWGANRSQTLVSIRAPAALPSLASGFKIAATLAPIGAIVGEWAGASGGLGYVMLQANARMQTDLVFACLVLLAAMAFLLRQSVSLVADRLVYWQGRSS